MTSESERGLPSQPKDTCPMIDRVIDVLNNIIKSTRNHDRIDSVEDLHSVISDIRRDIDLDDDMEKIRTNVCLIRDWGQRWKDYAKELEDELHKLKLDRVN